MSSDPSSTSRLIAGLLLAGRTVLRTKPIVFYRGRVSASAGR
jgi:hypothetical protein